ncbi:Aldo/keto reductase [Delitschia confertaspora ATCC 74209]|uniref:Aldo/keto reductase n=1 Tax=Delitschia confertaspora ATCC 74209 TaxID=1513339 RepID=A0A9P4JG23_9PLEO|nr:Aldo/keto reductase [Delitschia confertaspora ATCC 74209]
MSPPSLLMGCGGLGPIWSQDPSKLAEDFKRARITGIDCAARYPADNPGGSEKRLGECKLHEEGFAIDTKILIMGNGDGSLSEGKIIESVERSLKMLGVDKLNVLYCHGPDRTTPLEEQASTLDSLYRAGKFSKLGISNFDPEMLSSFLAVCKEKGYVKPSVYQGQYNLLCRTYESTLFPLLHKHNVSFIGFSPLAGGYLTGKLTLANSKDELRGTRFEEREGNIMGMAFRYWYDKPAFHDAIRKMEILCKDHGISLADAAWRWVLYHSALSGEKGDGVVIGPSTVEQLEGYAEGFRAGPLPRELAEELGGVWEGVREEAGKIVRY